MKKLYLLLLSLLMAFLMLFSVVACNEGGNVTPEPTPTPEPETDIATKFYMQKGWAQETPVWDSKDEGTVTVPDVIVSGDGEHEVTNVTPELKAALAEALSDPDYFKDVKNIIIIIGDGMGVSHVQASEHWSGELIMTQLPNVGISTTVTREGEITDSAAGGTAISAGYKTTTKFVNMDAEGNDYLSVSELARSQGKLVGLVSNAILLDATLADFTVHNKNRSQGWTKIGEQEIVFGPDLFMGTDRNDEYNTNEFADKFTSMSSFVEANNIKKYTNAASIVSHFKDDVRMWAIFTNKNLQDRLARYDYQNDKHPNLQQMATYALAWLDEHDNGEGFLLMIENTYDDHFGHGNPPYNTGDGGDKVLGIVKEVQSTDEVVAIALKYVLEHPDTALIVTADHETGGVVLRDGWEKDFSVIKSTSGSHTKQNVPVFAIGKGTAALNTLTRSEEERAAGLRWDKASPYENAKIGQVIGKLLGVDDFGGDVDSDNSSKISPKFNVTVDSAANEVSFTLDLYGVPIDSNDLIRFKIKPMSAADSVRLDLGGAKDALFDTASFSTAKADGALSPAYKFAMDSSSGLLSGWYQFSLNASTSSRQLTVTLTSGTGGFKAGDVIEIDDLTIDYASTIGWLKFSSENATATTASGAPLLKYYTELK